jgi:hypothetical protein
MDMITANDVIRRIDLHFTGGLLKPLSNRQIKAAQRGINASRSNPFDLQPVTIHNARMAFEDFAASIPPGDQFEFAGSGIVICGGTVRYFTCAWVCIRMLRRLGCELPIELWHLGKNEMDAEMARLVRSLGVTCVDADRMRRARGPCSHLNGWSLKAYAAAFSRFRTVLFLDADNVPVKNPEYLFQIPEFLESGAIFWPDYGRFEQTEAAWRICGVRRPEGPEFESGQMVLDKERCWRGLMLALWLNEHSDFFYKHLHGDKETFHIAFEKLGLPYKLVPTLPQELEGTMCQHDFSGNRVFQHRNMDKWRLTPGNKEVQDFWFEKDCFEFLSELRKVWSGRATGWRKGSRMARHWRRRPAVAACMITCPERSQIMKQTLAKLHATDWGQTDVFVATDRVEYTDHKKRQVETSLRALQGSLESRADYILFLEDDLEFNRHILHNLLNWAPIVENRLVFGSLYNPNVFELAVAAEWNTVLADPRRVFGSQALILSRKAVCYCIEHWDEADDLQDIRISNLAGSLTPHALYHTPSLVQHIGVESVWGGDFHSASDFDDHWKAPLRPG